MTTDIKPTFTSVTKALTVCLAVQSLIGCNKSEDKAPPAGSGVVDEAASSQSVQPSGRQRRGLSTVSAPGIAELVGLPADPSNATNLDVRVEGATVSKYIYAIVDGGSGCNDVTFSEPRTPDLHIDDTLTGGGNKLLCVTVESLGDDGAINVGSLSYGWTVDLTPPVIANNALTVAGPNAQVGANMRVYGDAGDAGSGVASVKISVKKGNGSSTCLSSDKSSFNAPCPAYHPGLFADSRYYLDIPDAAFSQGQSYQLSVQAEDVAGNIAEKQTGSFAWDASPPASVSALTATGGPEQVALSWTAASGASSYILIGRESAAVAYAPQSDVSYSTGQFLSDDHFVAYVGGGLSSTSVALRPFTHYHFKVFAIDEAQNIAAGGAVASAQTSAFASFQGLTNALVWGPGRRIRAEWQTFAKSGVALGSMHYGLFASGTSDQQNFAVPQAEVSAQGQLSYVDGGTNENLFLISRAWGPDGLLDNNKRELRLKFGGGIHHKIASNGRYYGQDPLTQTYLRSPWAVDVDPFTNVIFGGAQGVIHALCLESTQAYYCRGREVGKVYTIAGSDGVDNGSDGSLASASPLGDIYGIDFDTYGNMYLADATFFRVRAVCFNPLAPGVCNGKTIGYAYVIAGTGASADGLDDQVAADTAIGIPYAVQVDPQGNIYIADGGFNRIRAVCYGNTGFCANKISGNIFNLAGTGVVADGADNSQALASSFGSPRTLSRDVAGNFYFTDFDYRRIRGICLNVGAGSGFCAGKTAGNVYRIMGTGVAGDGVNNAVAAATAMGNGVGLAVSAAGNIYVTDSYFRLRVVCQEASLEAFCSGKTIGNVYRLAGSGASTDGANNILAITGAIGDPRNLSLDSSGNIVIADSLRKRVRLICASSSSTGLCSGRLPEYHYYLVGTGDVTMGWQNDALRTPIGNPQGTAIDSVGNVYYGDSTAFMVRVTCYNVTSPGICSGKTAGFSYFIAGTGVTGNAADNVQAVANPIGTPMGLDVDSDDNLYITDNTNRMIRVLCSNVAGSGFCAGKVSGNLYRFAGSGVNGDAADNTLAFSANLGMLADVALDSYDNLFIADPTVFRVRLVCQSTLGACAGKTIGNIYRFSGTGVTGNGADGALTSNSAIGAVTAVELDPWNNVAIGDSTYFRVRYACQNTAGGFCVGKTAGNSYYAAGTGVTGDGVSNLAATSSAIGVPYGLAIDSGGNLYLADSTARRIRAICVDTDVGFCTGLTTGYSYRMFSTGVAGDSSSGIAGALVRLDTPNRDSLALTSTGDFIYVGSSGSVRMFMAYE